MSYRVTFNHAALINGKTQSRFGAFDAMLDPEVATPKTNAVLTVYVAVYLFDGYTDPQVTKNGMAEEAREEANKPAKKFKVYPWDPQKHPFKAVTGHDSSGFSSGPLAAIMG